MQGQANAPRSGVVKFTLALLPDGRAILASREPLTEQDAIRIRQGFEEWKATPGGLTIVPECDVVQVQEIELEISGQPQAVS